MVQRYNTQQKAWLSQSSRQMWGSYGGHIDDKETISMSDTSIPFFPVIEKGFHNKRLAIALYIDWVP